MHERINNAASDIHQLSSHTVGNTLWLSDFHTMSGRKIENQDSLLMTTCLPYRALTSTCTDGHPSFSAPLLVLMADGVSACQFPKQASQLVVNTVTQHLTLALENMVKADEASTEHQDQSFSEMQDNTKTAFADGNGFDHSASFGSSGNLKNSAGFDDFDDHQIAILIKEAVHKANDELYFPQDYQRVPPLLSTLSGLLCIGDRIHLFHTGDSRIYRVGMDSMVLLTKDHHIHQGRDKGALSAAIGADTRVELQQSVFTLHQNEGLALMTDGVYEFITATELQFELCAAVAARHQSTGTTKPGYPNISQSLCKQAFNEGSHDNLSVMTLSMNPQATKLINPNSSLLQQGQSGDEDEATAGATEATVTHTQDANHTQGITHYQLPTGLEVGAQIDHFTVKKIIARTARSEVYLVEDTNHHPFVLKSPSLNTIADGHYLREFLKERKIGLSLSKHRSAGEPAYNQVDPHSMPRSDTGLSGDSHKHTGSTFHASGLLRYYPVPASSTYLYHLTEYIEGESLRSFMDRHAPCDIWQTYDLLTKIGMAVRVMHRNYLLHQDIKPENVLLTKSGTVKLIDFGSASSSILKDSTRPPNGDLHYAAPEYYTDAPKGAHSDLFSIAVIGYELLTGELPFSSQALMSPSQSLVMPIQLLRQRQVPATSQQALMRALHTSTQARYQAIGEFLQDFGPDNSNHISDPEPLIVRHPLLVWHSICFIQFVIIISLLVYFS